MKSTSEQDTAKQDNVVKMTNDALDFSVSTLSEEQCADISKVRSIALSKAQSNSQFEFGSTFLKLVEQSSWLKLTAPVAAVFLVVITVNNVMVEPVPELPLAMINGEVPTEDLAMLEDLEFVIWLAKNEENIML